VAKLSNIGNKNTMAKNLLFYVERSGKTQREIAESINVSPSTFNTWINGNKYPRIDKIEMLANLFGILKSDLIEDREEIEKKNDTLSDIVIRLRGDDEFLSLVGTLYELDKEKITSVRLMLKALLK
jgi:transcriptional regulator with XRE-family HTH domain